MKVGGYYHTRCLLIHLPIQVELHERCDRAKYAECMRCTYVSDVVGIGTIAIHWVPTKRNLAHIFTKLLPLGEFKLL